MMDNTTDNKIHVCACISITEDDGTVSLRPEIPFSDFPAGSRSAAPDADGVLHWYVTPPPSTPEGRGAHDDG